MNDLLERAARRLQQPARRAGLALAFDQTVASTAEVHVEGRNFYPPMLEDIRRAESSVHVNQFGFRPGAVGDEFADALLGKASAGVAVRVIVDRQGSDPDRSGRAFFERLLAGGVDVRVVRATQVRGPSQPVSAGGPLRWNLGRLGHIDHRKVVVVDGRIGWVGGAGIEDHFQDGRFHDLFVRLTGPVVSQLQLVFLASFRWLDGSVRTQELDALFPAYAEPASIPAVVLHNAPGRYRPITTAIAQLLEGSRGSLDVVNPYVTDRGMIRRIQDAARRGVRVRLFVPADANNWACAAAQRFHHAELLAAGVRILEYPTMLHAKAFVRDGEDVLRARATSRPGASGASSRSTCSCARRRSRGSSRSGSRRPPRPCRRRGRRSPVGASGFGRGHLPLSHRFSRCCRAKEGAMIRIIEGLPENVLGVEAVGKVTEADYQNVLVPAVEAKLAEHKRIRYVYVLGEEFDGWTVGAMWEDAKLGAGELRRWERIAVVTDTDWVRHAVGAFGWMIPGDVRVFAAAELEEAKAWASADGSA